MDVLEEIYPGPEFYQMLCFCDLQPLRGEDWLDICNMKWNYTNQAYYYLEYVDVYTQYKLGKKVRRLKSCSGYCDDYHEIYESRRKVGKYSL